MHSHRYSLIWVLWMPLAVTGAPNEMPSIKWGTDAGVSPREIQSVKKVLLVAVPQLTVESQFCEDVLAVELMAAEISVVSRERRDRELISRIESASEEERQGDDDTANDQGRNRKDVKTERRRTKLAEADLMAVAIATEADVLVRLQLVTETAQENVTSQDGMGIVEVRSKLVVKAASLTVVEAKNGRLLLAGYVGYEAGVSILEAARDLGRGMVRQMKID